MLRPHHSSQRSRLRVSTSKLVLNSISDLVSLLLMSSTHHLLHWVDWVHFQSFSKCARHALHCRNASRINNFTVLRFRFRFFYSLCCFVRPKRPTEHWCSRLLFDNKNWLFFSSPSGLFHVTTVKSFFNYVYVRTSDTAYLAAADRWSKLFSLLLCSPFGTSNAFMPFWEANIYNRFPLDHFLLRS